MIGDPDDDLLVLVNVTSVEGFCTDDAAEAGLVQVAVLPSGVRVVSVSDDDVPVVVVPLDGFESACDDPASYPVIATGTVNFRLSDNDALESGTRANVFGRQLQGTVTDGGGNLYNLTAFLRVRITPAVTAGCCGATSASSRGDSTAGQHRTGRRLIRHSGRAVRWARTDRIRCPATHRVAGHADARRAAERDSPAARHRGAIPGPHDGTERERSRVAGRPSRVLWDPRPDRRGQVRHPGTTWHDPGGGRGDRGDNTSRCSVPPPESRGLLTPPEP